MESKKKLQNRWIFCIELQCVQIYMTLIGNKKQPCDFGVRRAVVRSKNELLQQCKMREDTDQRVRDGGHGLDEDVQRDADDVLTGVTDGIAGNSCLVGR